MFISLGSLAKVAQGAKLALKHNHLVPTFLLTFNRNNRGSSFLCGDQQNAPADRLLPREFDTARGICREMLPRIPRRKQKPDLVVIHV